jgi:hypothetical protein
VAKRDGGWLTLQEAQEELINSRIEERKLRISAKQHIKQREYEAAISSLTDALSHKAFREGLKFRIKR